MSHARVKLPACANCAYPFPEEQPNEFCPRCGQQNHEINLSFGHVLEETLEGVFHFDSKVFRTLRLLLFKPGRLTQLFNDGHRVDFVPPIRLYVFISFVFFLLLSLQRNDSGKKENILFDVDVSAATDAEKRELASADSLVQGMVEDKPFKATLAFTQPTDSTNIFDLKISRRDLQWFSEHATAARTDSMIRANGKEPTWYRRLLLNRFPRIQNATKAEIGYKLQKSISIAMFLLMPLFALLLKALYIRHHRYYLSHLILSIHFHCFVFLLFTAKLLLGYVYNSDWVVLVMLLLPAWYLYKGLRYIYQQSRRKTLAKVLLMMISYGLVIALVLMGALVASLMMV
ncbi:DUF3667 domain-containing protein [Hymenobacter sp. BT730]|uniref:DUF3667 domain-containing protein n=1 Tax=Hymenobacter sp. BT730 TaxID=3063332 RepID=UPI0026DEA5E8|nr:DUF3667 domain-containing protein [Hymenobacter sp. BT730]